MPIQELFVPEAIASNYGLHPVRMRRLGKFVAIAGRNGSGKSRLLNMLEAIAGDRNGNLQDVDRIRRRLAIAVNQVEQSGDTAELAPTISDLKRRIESATELLNPGSKEQISVLRFVPKVLQTKDPQQQSPKAIIEQYGAAKTSDIGGFHNCCGPYVQQLQNRWWNATHQFYEGTDERQEIEDDYHRLKLLIETLLGTKLSRTADGAAALFGKPLAAANLSDGQQVILQLATAIHAQKARFGETVFLLDELENHLHPSAVVDLLDNLLAAAPRSQIWIATHSVPLLAHILSQDPHSLWYMEEGSISHAGRRPERVLEGLLGTQDKIAELHALTGLPSVLALYNYAAESLLPPGVVGDGKDDSQVSQIHRVIRSKFGGRPLSMLDYGAGKGRLLDGLAALNGAHNLAGSLNYFAFDSFDDDAATCKAVIATYYGDATGRYFSKPDEFYESQDDGVADVVVLCNALHEITPARWLDLFSPSNLMQRSLSSEGYLLIVEDTAVPIGEKAHEYGFLVLDTAQLKTLFDVKAEDIAAGRFIADDARGDGRLKAHLVSKSLLNRVTAGTRRQAIEHLKEAATRHVREIRQRDVSYKSGQVHGFWTQQLANAHLYLLDA